MPTQIIPGTVIMGGDQWPGGNGIVRIVNMTGDSPLYIDFDDGETISSNIVPGPVTESGEYPFSAPAGEVKYFVVYANAFHVDSIKAIPTDAS